MKRTKYNGQSVYVRLLLEVAENLMKFQHYVWLYRQKKLGYPVQGMEKSLQEWEQKIPDQFLKLL